MSDLVDALGRSGRRRERAQLPHVHWATVRRVTSQGVMVTVDHLGDQRLVGPCAWAREHEEDDPPSGTRCLVASPTKSVSDVAVVMFAGWPAGGEGQA